MFLFVLISSREIFLDIAKRLFLFLTRVFGCFIANDWENGTLPSSYLRCWKNCIIVNKEKTA